MNTLLATCTRDLRGGFRRQSRFLLPPAFFILTVLLFPLALGPEAGMLSLAAPGLLAVAALLAAFLPLDALFRVDRDDGSLDIILTSAAPLPLYVAGKIAAHWLLTGLPLAAASPLLALMLGLPAAKIPAVMLVLTIVTLLLTLIGALGAALALGARQGSGGILLALLVMPLYIPVLIFGAHAIDMEAGSPLLFLWAMLAVAVPVVPLAAAAMIKGLSE